VNLVGLSHVAVQNVMILCACLITDWTSC